MTRFVAAIDQGTTSTRCMLFNHRGEVAGVHQLEHQQIYPRPGWVEHDALEIWERTQSVIRAALYKAGAAAQDIAAVGITNQRETTLVWNRRTGKPYHNAVVWQDTRTDRICAELAEAGGRDRFRSRVGLPLATYFSGPKLRWLLDNVPGLRGDAERGDAIFGNMDTWLIWNLTGGVRSGAHVTDITNASRTMLMDLPTLRWDTAILDAMGIPPAMLPAIRPSSDPRIYGYTADNGPFL
ncbi:MAG: glycerol kinase, partial [Caldilineaceae bacterium]|nr:glycerol kinase [Caldilineaceae bacterium]